MAWQSSGHSNHELIHNLAQHGVIKSKVVEHAMKAVDRAHYTPHMQYLDPYQDAPQSIGYGATISAPHMHAMCLEALKDQLQPGAKALDVGSGSGYLVACMAHMVGERGHVYGIEHISQLVTFSQQNVKSEPKDVSDRITILEGDGRLGLPKFAPFDAIHVGAAADKIPDALKQQLTIGGRLVIPVGPATGHQSLLVIDRTSETTWTQEEICGVRYVPLTDAKKQIQGMD